VLATPPCAAADVWGGSVGVTNDYIVRGMTRTDGQAALQLDLHYANSNGWIAGAFASNARIEPNQPSDVELDAFLGFTGNLGGDWRGKVVANRYFYVSHGSAHEAEIDYDYNEFQLDLAYRDWLDLALIYSPDQPRYVTYLGLFASKSLSAEINVQRSVWKRLSATLGVGYSYFDGPDAQGYGYWSVGASYDLAPVSLSVSFVDTTPGAKALFYNEAARGRLTASAIWRF
jgi:uncharacterized protein (TIGR02001 family)